MSPIIILLGTHCLYTEVVKTKGNKTIIVELAKSQPKSYRAGLLSKDIFCFKRIRITNKP